MQTEEEMTAQFIVMNVLAGGLLGLLGQGVRVIAGLKKASEDNKLADVFVANKLLVSLLIGFVSGGWAMLSMAGREAVALGGGNAGFAIVAAGYAGTDFIEAFMKKHVRSETPAGPVLQEAR